jgi:hypothetical protein
MTNGILRSTMLLVVGIEVRTWPQKSTKEFH